jgi:hypothetical protein
MKLSKTAIRRAINHLIRFGDTDILPLTPENVFLWERREEVAAQVASIDLDSFKPMQAIEMIAPKSRFGFRIVHQLPLLETLLFTASVIEIGGDLEKLKQPPANYGPFAYRFKTGSGASLFHDNRGYRDWLAWQFDAINGTPFDEVIFTDIADFYQRIYSHRVENVLDTATAKKNVNKFIGRIIKQIRGKQSHGLPVGGSAARVLAEAVLTDTDNALADEGYAFTRYMDDYRIFVRRGESPYRILAFLAEQLATSEGLSLNAQKTRIVSIDSLRTYLSAQLSDVYDDAQQSAIDALSHALYADEIPDEAQVDKLQSMNLVNALEEEVEKETWDFSKIKSIFLGLRVTEDDSAVKYLEKTLATFFPFMKEIVLFFDVMHSKGKLNSSRLSDAALHELGSGSAQSVPAIRVWLLELFVRGCLKIENRTLAALEGADTASNCQIYLIHGLNKDVNYFRRNKTRFEQRNAFEKYYFILGATCLPDDEYRAWLSAIEPNMARPLDQLFCKWVRGKRGQLPEVLRERIVLARG